MNRRMLLIGSMSLLGLAVAGTGAALPSDLEVDLKILDNAIDTTRLKMNTNRGLRIALLGLNPRQFNSWEAVRTYARMSRPRHLFEIARFLVALRQQVIDRCGVKAVAAAMDWGHPWGEPESVFHDLLKASGYKYFGEDEHDDWYRDLPDDANDVYFGDIRPVLRA